MRAVLHCNGVSDIKRMSLQISYIKELWSVELKCQLWMHYKQIDYKHFVQQKLSVQKNMGKYIFCI